MSTVFTLRHRFVVWPNDHAAPAHAIGPGWEIKVGLGGCEHIKPWLMEVTGSPTTRQLRRVLLAVDQHCAALAATWRDIHGI
jgi:hypothetical protein